MDMSGRNGGIARPDGDLVKIDNAKKK